MKFFLKFIFTRVLHEVELSTFCYKLLDLRQVLVNPVLEKKSDRTALFFEGCLSVDGYRAVVERYLDVQVRGLDRYGQPIKVDASGWQARVLQHECDHLEGTLYVDKMVQRTFRAVENLALPLAVGCPKLGPKRLSKP